jgi:hypothetical protein
MRGRIQELGERSEKKRHGDTAKRRTGEPAMSTYPEGKTGLSQGF